MTDIENPSKTIDEILSQEPDALGSHAPEHRRAIRYLRDDIEAAVSKRDVFAGLGFNLFRKPTPVELLDISCRGVLIATPENIRINAKILLLLEFKTGKRFKINAVVARKSGQIPYEYGLKFDRYNNDLGECLLSTQTDLKFS